MTPYNEIVITYRSSSGGETIHLGRRLGLHLHEGDVVALTGQMGSGKTWFTKGLALGLGVPPDEVVTSPTFALVNSYEGRCTLFHLDVYRLETVDDFLNAGLEEFLRGEGVAVVEWADRWPEILPVRHVRVHLVILNDHSRELVLSARYPEGIAMLNQLRQEG